MPARGAGEVARKRCIKPLETIIAERPNNRPQDFEAQNAHLEELVTELLEPDFDDDRTAYLVGSLRKLECPRAEVETIILSCLAYHEALGRHHTGGNWDACRGKWILACARFEISQWSVGQAISAGQHIRTKLHGEDPEAIRVAIHKMFFVDTDTIAELAPQPNQPSKQKGTRPKS